MSWLFAKRGRCTLPLLLFTIYLQLIHSLDFVHSVPAVSIHVDENLISQSNDSAYVAQIMRLSKSAEMRNFMNPDADVCDNFYEYACGNWARLNPAETSEKKETSLFNLLESSYKQKQLKILNEEKFTFGLGEDSQEEDDTNRDPNWQAVKKVKNFYKSCRHMALFRRDEVVNEIKEIINEFGVMPALLKEGQNWTEEANFDAFSILGSIQHRYGFDIILQLGLRPDFDNKSEHTLFVGQPSLKLKTKSVYTGIATAWEREEYRRKIAQNLEDFLGLERYKAQMVSLELLEFEIKLAQGLNDYHTDTTLKSKSIRRTPEELRTLYGENMNLLKFLENTLGYPLNVTCYEYSVEYHEVLRDVIGNASKSQVANYIMYQLVEPFFIEYDRPIKDMEDLCLEKTKIFFSHIIDSMIYRSFDTHTIQYDILTMWREIKLAFRSQLSSPRLDWLSAMSRKLAEEKLERIAVHINSHENRNFSAEYGNLQMTNNKYFENLKQLHNMRVQRFLQHLSRPGMTEWSNHQLANAPAYFDAENLILIPVSLLQPNYLWSYHYPQALKFATLGFLLAHELIHAFDDMTRQVDSKGTELTLWWDEPTAKAFKHKKSCFKTQYAHFRFNGKYLPISELQKENIADNGAIQLAYKAYLQWLNLQALETLDELLPNLKINNKKLFFLSFAQYFCMDGDYNTKPKESLLDTHVPAKFRVIGPLGNFAEFSKIYKCPQGTMMNPPRRCEVY